MFSGSMRKAESAESQEFLSVYDTVESILDTENVKLVYALNKQQ